MVPGTWWYWLVAALALSEPAIAVVIQEVLYDPTSESGGEAVLLYNQDDVSVDISGWTLSTEASSADASLPPGSFLPPQGTFLIADVGWENAKDPSLPSADREESITMYNSDSGIAVRDSTGMIVDAVGWGSAGGIAAGLYEGTPHAGVSENRSLVRIADTGDNSADFVEADPSFIVLTGAVETPLVLDVNGSGVLAITDVTLSAQQLRPVPGIGANLTISVTTSAPAVVVSIAESVIDAAEQAPGMYYAVAHLPYWLAPDNYTVAVTASNGTDTVATDVVFEYLPLTAAGLDLPALSFSRLVPGATTTLAGDNDPATMDKPTIINLGNTPIDIVLAATTAKADELSLSLSNIKYSLDGSFISALSGTLKTGAQTRKVSLPPRGTLPFSLQVSVPVNAKPGTYVGAVKVSGKQSI